MVVNLRWKMSICSQGAESGAEFLHLGKRDPAWKPITSVPLIGFYSRAIQSCAFRKYQLNTGMGRPSLRRAKGRTKGLRATHGTGSEFPVSVSLKRCRSAHPAVRLAPASQINYSIAHLPFSSSSGGGRGHGAFLLTKVVLGRPWSTRPIFIFYWITVQKGILHQKP